MARLKEQYEKEMLPELQKELQLKNKMEVPRVEKVVINMGLGEAIQNIKVLESAVEELGHITGQKAMITRAKRSIAQFKLREDMPIGCAVTLRRDRAYEFLDRLIKKRLCTSNVLSADVSFCDLLKKIYLSKFLPLWGHQWIIFKS